jgi:hypothetical protein
VGAAGAGEARSEYGGPTAAKASAAEENPETVLFAVTRLAHQCATEVSPELRAACAAISPRAAPCDDPVNDAEMLTEEVGGGGGDVVYERECMAIDALKRMLDRARRAAKKLDVTTLVASDEAGARRYRVTPADVAFIDRRMALPFELAMREYTARKLPLVVQLLQSDPLLLGADRDAALQTLLLAMRVWQYGNTTNDYVRRDVGEWRDLFAAYRRLYPGPLREERWEAWIRWFLGDDTSNTPPAAW